MADATCSIDGCEKPVCARTWCDMHYRRWRRRGAVGEAASIHDHPSGCTISGCDRPYKSNGMCKPHAVRARLGRDLAVPFVGVRTACSIEGCAGTHVARGWCSMHYQRWRRGEPLDPPATHAGSPGRRRVFVGYKQAHARARRLYGPNPRCVDCNGPAHEMSYNGKDPNELIDPDTKCPFSCDPSFYEPRCISCHRTFDATRSH